MRGWITRLRNGVKKPITRRRIGFWVSIVLGFLLGRTLECPRCGRKYARTFPFIFRGKLYLFGLHGDFVRPVFESQNQLAFECLTCVSGVPGKPGRVVPAARRIHQIVLGHQPPDHIGRTLAYMRKLAPELPISLVYGGTREDFEKVEWPGKVFCDDPHLRGSPLDYNHRGLFDTMARFAGDFADDDWILFTESDCIPLRRNYHETIVALAEESGADFAACRMANMTGTNGDLYQREISKGNGKWLEAIVARSCREETKRVYHCLGCLMLFRARFLRQWLEAPQPDVSVYFEIYVPTLAYHLGHELFDLNRAAGLFDFCRYQPEIREEDVETITKGGALFIHPVKWKIDGLRARCS